MSEHEAQPSHGSSHGDAHSDGHSKKHSHAGHGGGHEEGHEGAPEWLISFADNVTLMMGFFVILLAMTMADVGKGANGDGDGKDSAPSSSAMEMAIAIREAFHNPVNMASTDPEDLPLVEYLLAREAAEAGGAVDRGAPGKRPEVQSIRPGDYYAVGGVVHFEPAVAAISAEGQKTIDSIAKRIRGLRLVLEIRGHSSRAESEGDATAAMKLSFERAHGVAEALVAGGVLWEQLRLVSLGENDPLEKHTYDDTQTRIDQRVEIVLTDELMREPS